MTDRRRPTLPPDLSIARSSVVDLTGVVGRALQLPRILAVRERDHLLFEVSWSGLRLVYPEGEPALTRSSAGEGHLIVIFAPQNLAEKAYYQRFEGGEKDQEFNTEAGEVIDVDIGNESPDPPPVDALMSDESRLVFRVPKGTTIPLTVDDLLEWTGRLKLSVPGNALPREFRLQRVLVPASDLLAGAVAYRGNQSAIERILTSGRMRERVRGVNPMLAERADELIGVIESHLLVSPDSRVRAIGGSNVTDARLAIREIIGTFRRKRPKPAPPEMTQTAIESPYRLLISPSSVGGWAHSAEAVERNGRVELWHTRLGVRDDEGQDFDVDERTEFQRVVRAVWARGIPNLEDSANPPPPAAHLDPVTGQQVGPPLPFRMSLDDRDRHNLVHLSSNFAIKHNNRFYSPEPVVVNRLMLTSLGSWMDFAGKWNPEPKGLSIEEWIHRATLGRDHYVRVVYKGFLACPGNRSTLVKITERMFASDVDKDWGQSDNPAYLTQRMFIIVKEAEKTFTNSNETFEGSKRFANANPLQSIRIVDRQTPDLDPPPDRTQFVPHVGGKPFLFTVVVTDIEGNVSTVKMPLLFVDKTVDEVRAKLQPALETYNNPSDVSGVDFSGQRVAFAPAKGVDDTSFETSQITFEATIPDQANFNAPGPHFLPRVLSAQVVVPAIRQLTGLGESLNVQFGGTYLTQGFGGVNKGEVLFEVASHALNLVGKADKTGGLASPSIKIIAISRLVGPVGGTISTLEKAKFDPTDFFQGLQAKLFGVIPLSAVIEEVASFTDDLPKVPRFIGKTIDEVEGFLDDLSRILALVEEKTALLNLVEPAIDDVVDGISQMLGGANVDPTQALDDLDDALAGLENALPGDLPIGVVNDVKAIVSRARNVLADVAKVVDLIETLVKGVELPRSVDARFEWRPAIKPWPNETNPLFVPESDSLVLSAEARGSVDEGADFVVSAALENFKLNLIGESNKFIVLDFEKIQLLIQAGKKPEVDVVLKDIVFTGVLAFVETLKDLIPLDAFSDPPAVTVDTSGIRADLSIGLPNISVGVFSLENLALGAGFVVPFIGDPLSVYFRFCERENPAMVSVSLFAGGFYFGITLDPDGVRILEAAIEFGANVSMDFGVASGGVSAMAGIYFKLEQDDATLAGYFRVRGHVRALGIVTVSIELYLELSYEFATDKCVGRAQLKISIELFLFEATITISCEKKFAGSGADPTFAQTMSPYLLDPADPATLVDPWEEYCVAFA